MEFSLKQTLDEIDQEEFSVSSPDPAKRILARRRRMQLREQLFTSDDSSKEKINPEQSETEEQMLSSSNHLNLLLTESDEVVSNIRIANDAREIARRKAIKEIKEKLFHHLEENAQKCSEHYKLISAKWDSILSNTDVLDINSDLEEQNKKCLEVLSIKDAVIAELKQELENCDIKFVADQLKQNEEINLLIDRIDNQVYVMNKAYAEELSRIDGVLDRERRNLLDSTRKKWEALFKRYEEENINGIELRKEIMREYEEEVEKMMTQHYEDYRDQKIKLETEYQTLQQQLEYTKSLCMLNTEKLNFNYIILKRREDENMIIKNYQRKKFNKLQDIVKHYKKMVFDTKQSIRFGEQQMADQIIKLRNKIIDLETKACQSAISNEEQYFKIWEMNASSASELLDKILEINKRVYEEILGLKWEPPELQLLNKENLPSYRKAKANIEKRKADMEKKLKALQPTDAPIDLMEVNLQRRLLNKLFLQISDKSELFIEERLRAILGCRSKENMIIKLDSVFNALDIVSEQDIQSLFKLFLPHLFCSTCTAISEETTEDSSSFSTFSTECESYEKQPIRVIADVLNEASCTAKTTDSSENVLSDVEENETTTCVINEEKIVSVDIKETGTLKEKLLCERGHLLDIKTTHVIAVLKDFVTKHSEIKGKVGQKLMERKYTISRNISVEDITSYWTRYTEIFSQKDEELWDVLLIELNKYLDILKERQKIEIDVEKLKQQNSELNRLLRTYDLTISNNK